jgi:hypothetical protein
LFSLRISLIVLMRMRGQEFYVLKKMPADGAGLPAIIGGEFGASPFRGQPSGKQNA